MLFNNPFETILVVLLVSLAVFLLVCIMVNLVRDEDIRLVELGGFLMMMVALGLLFYLHNAGFFAPTQEQAAMPAMPDIPRPAASPTFAPEPTVVAILPLPGPEVVLEAVRVEPRAPVESVPEVVMIPEMMAAAPAESAPAVVTIPKMAAAPALPAAAPPVFVVPVPTLTWSEEVLRLEPEPSWNPATPTPPLPGQVRADIAAVLTGSYAARTEAYATGDFSGLEDYFTGPALEYEALRIAAFRSRYDCSQELHLEAPLRVDVSVYEKDGVAARAFLTKLESRICHRNGQVDPAPNLTVYNDFYTVELALKRIDGRWYISDRPYP